MRIFKILRVFLGLKVKEFIHWYGWKEVLFLFLIMICGLVLLLGIIFLTMMFENIMLIASFIIGLGVILIILFLFFKWLIELCKDNWQKAKKIVNDKSMEFRVIDLVGKKHICKIIK